MQFILRTGYYRNCIGNAGFQILSQNGCGPLVNKLLTRLNLSPADFILSLVLPGLPGSGQSPVAALPAKVQALIRFLISVWE